MKPVSITFETWEQFDAWLNRAQNLSLRDGGRVHSGTLIEAAEEEGRES